MYGKGVEARIRAMKFQGELEHESVRAEMTNPVCGDVLRLSLDIRDGIVRQARWKAEGCPPTLAAADLLVEWIVGKAVGELERINVDEIVTCLEGLPATSRHAVQLAVSTLRSALTSKNDSA